MRTLSESACRAYAQLQRDASRCSARRERVLRRHSLSSRRHDDHLLLPAVQMLRIYLGFYSGDSILGEHSKIHLSYSVLHRAYLASFSSFVLASCLIHWACLCWHVNSALSEHPAFTGEPNAKTGTRARTRMWLVIFISNPPYRFCWLCYPTTGPRGISYVDIGGKEVRIDKCKGSVPCVITRPYFPC
jgi:hypothetical protein